MTNSYTFYAQLGELEVHYRPPKEVGEGIKVSFMRDDSDDRPSFAIGWVPSCKVESPSGFDEGDVRALELFLRNNAAIIVESVIAADRETELSRRCELCGHVLKIAFEDELARFRGRDVPLFGVERMRCSNPACGREDTYTARQMQDIEDRLRLATIGDLRKPPAVGLKEAEE